MEARASQVFVGRARELGTLERLLEEARTGNGGAALIAGEAGIGKTRLASELGRRGRDAGFTTLVGRSIDLVGTDLPYQPFVDALRPLGLTVNRLPIKMAELADEIATARVSPGT